MILLSVPLSWPKFRNVTELSMTCHLLVVADALGRYAETLGLALLDEC